LPEHRTVQNLLELHGAPLLATTLILPGETEALDEAAQIRHRLEHEVAAVIDTGTCPREPTTIIDLVPMGSGHPPEVIRLGRGSLSAIGLA
jgi:tRNA A37 threonylcarbamoyladenosine synthetase subunit TsaC/SUA5/YrdC